MVSDANWRPTTHDRILLRTLNRSARCRGRLAFAAPVALWRTDVGVQARGPRALVCFAVSCAIVTGLFFWQGWQGFNLYDEGFLWYGAQRVIAGEVPLRDFQVLRSRPVLLVRRADDALGRQRDRRASCCGCGISGRGTDDRPAADLRKQPAPERADDDSGSRDPQRLDVSAPQAVRHNAVRCTDGGPCLACPQSFRKSCFAAGVVVGLAAIFGRNHGVYGVAASIGAIAYLASRENALRLWPLWRPGRPASRSGICRCWR